MGSKRRFRLEKQPLYDHWFDLLRVNSPVLNQPDSYYTKEALLFEKIKLEGVNGTGEFDYNGVKYTSLIKSLKNKLEELDKKFEIYCTQRINGGYEKPDKMPPEMHEQKMKLQAENDVLEEEVEDISRRLKTYTDKESKESNDNLLAYGLRCTGKLKGGQLVLLDNQTIVRNKDGILVISNGPYRGMAVTDYRILCDRWAESRRQADRNRLLQLQEQSKAEGKLIPFSLGVKSPRKVSKESLPPFPEEFKRYEL